MNTIEGLEINLQELLNKNISRFGENDEFKISMIEKLLKNFQGRNLEI